MAKQQETNITDWVRRTFLGNALIPLLIIGMALLGAYLLTNELAYDKHVTSLEKYSDEQLLNATGQQAALIGEKLRQVSNDTGYFAQQVRTALSEPPMQRLDMYKKLRSTPGGALFTAENTGGFAVYYSGIKPIGPPEIQKLERLLRVDPVMQGVMKNHPEVAQIYFNSHDSLNIIYPYFDVLSLYPEKMDIPKYNFYYEADAKHDPQRQSVWTGVYVDPAGKGWMTSCIAPVYSGDFLEGVVGMDITVSSVIKQLQELPIPWKGYRVLLDGDGTLMALPPQGEQDWDLREMTSHHYAEAIREDTFKPERFNILKHAEGRTWGKDVLQHRNGIRRVQLNGDKLLAWSTVPYTQWKLLALVPASEIFSTARQLRLDIKHIGILMAAGLLLFYLVFFLILARKARLIAARISRPLLDISLIAREIEGGRFEHQAPDTPLKEIRETGESVVHMGRALKGEIQARRKVEQALQGAYDEVEHQVRERTEELEVEIRERRRLERALRLQAEYDALTGLPNRHVFFDRAQQALALARRHKSPAAILFIDLDNFKPINDSLGHKAGDDLLKEVATRLRACVRESDTVARFGGDEFVILLIDFTPTQEPEDVARAIIERISSPVDLDQERVTISGSIGIALYPDDGDSVDELLHQADTAMYRAKEVGKNSFRFAAGAK
jgi:diguanylate cyclase (GGDEF)-like protein